MLSCKKTSELIEKQLYFGLNPFERIQLFMHTSMCSACSAWKKQSKNMDSAMHNHIHNQPEKDNTSEAGLSDEAKAKILKKLNDNQN